MAKRIPLAAGIAALTCLPALAQAQPAAAPAVAPPACLRAGEIYSFNPVNNRTLIVEDNLHKKFKVSLTGFCPNLTFKVGVSFRSRDSSRLSCLQPADNVIVSQPGIGPIRCPIRSVVAYTPAMQKADAAAAAAKASGH